MQYEVKTISVFERQFKRLVKKYRSLKTDLESLVADLEKEPSMGTPLGKNCFKVRLSITSKNKGKSGGARIITHFIVNESNVYLLSIYDKSDKSSITDKELVELLNDLSMELQ
ncbi:MAG: type II toxin-antitoxin system RelE/ParE family toxin [Fibromonadales bacterium]|nr:type II toxin-antitoxin system RelE/ParE family toxin [Fibromonadales bacterium]